VAFRELTFQKVALGPLDRLCSEAYGESFGNKSEARVQTSARVLVVGVAVCLLSAVDLSACGDKYLSVGRGARYQRGYVSLRPVAVAVLRHAASGKKDFLSRLKMAGHRVEVMNDVAAMKTRLAASKFAVVLADYEDAAAVTASFRELAAKPLFLPVVDAGSTHAAAAHKEYGCLLSGDTKSKQQNFLAVLDEAVESSLREKPVKCDLKL